MDDIVKRLGSVESSVSELRVQISGVVATIPYLATKEDLNQLRAQFSGIAAQMPFMATKADLNNLETRLIKWMVATVLAAVGTATGLAFSIAKFVH